MSTDRSRPDLDDTTVEGLGKLSEALETVEQARGLLYGFDQLTGKADLLLQDAVELLREAGHRALAEDLDRNLIGRNVVADRWTFQIVEDYDESYWAAFRSFDERARVELADGNRHVHEARMKQRERTKGHPRHEPGPPSKSDHIPVPADTVDRSRGREASRPGHGQRLIAAGNGTWPRCRPEGDDRHGRDCRPEGDGVIDNEHMTMPAPDDDERDAQPLGSESAPPGDAESQGGANDGVVGPSYPPAETEPDAS